MTPSFKRKLVAAVFVPALALAASTTYAMGDKTTPSANATGTTTTAPATTNSMQGSMKSGTATSADATFARLDANHDGKLSASEAAADPKVQAQWKKIDVNNKGSVSKSEFEAHASALK
jgi:EF hand